jgi:hypothetical protein
MANLQPSLRSVASSFASSSSGVPKTFQEMFATEDVVSFVMDNFAMKLTHRSEEATEVGRK